MDNSIDFEVLPNAFMQNTPMQYGKLPQALPEITTKNSTDITSDISTNLSIYPSLNNVSSEILENCESSNSKLENGMMGGIKKKVQKDI